MSIERNGPFPDNVLAEHALAVQNVPNAGAKLGALASTLDASGRVTAASDSRNTPTLTVRLDGDSRFAGGASAMDDTTDSVRDAFWSAIRAKRGGVRLLGESISGRYIVNSGTPIPQVPLLGDWHVSATGGYTVAQIDAAATASEAASGAADVVCFTGAENDAAAGTTGAAILALISTYVANRKAAKPDGIVILCTQMVDSPALAGYAARNAILAVVNAGLPALAATFKGVYVLDVASLLGLADVNSSGNHPNGGGYAKWGAALAALVLANTGQGGSAFPRAVQSRVARARLVTVTEGADTAYVLDDGTKGILPQQDASFSFGRLYRPTTATPAYQRVVMALGNNAGLAGNVVLLEGPPYAGCKHATLQLYINGVLRSVHSDSIVIGRAHLIGVNVDRTRGEASIFCLREGDDGKPCTTLVSQVSGVVTWTYTFGRVTLAGTGCVINGSPGVHGDAWVNPTGLVTIDQMEAWYHEDALPAGAVHYPLNDGSGTTPAPAPSFASYPAGATNASWSAAGVVREPWHRIGQSANTSGAFAVNGATPVVVSCPGMCVGDEAGITLTRSVNGGTVGPVPAIVCAADQFTATGTAADTSTYAWRFRP
jgi:hypothetical protein